MSGDDDYLPLSGLQHLLFCERQCALIHVEQIWEESRLTAEGRILHEKADAGGVEKRRDVKRVFGLPLRRDARAVLGRAPAAPVSVPPRRAPTDWAAEEFGAARLGDARLARRLQRIARDFFAQPQASIPQACQGRAKTKATYRFLEHPETTMDAILQPHYAATHQRMQAEATVLAVQDTTDLNYATHRETAGLGPIGSQKDGAVGLLVHDTLAITPDGRPLGLLDVQCWARDAAAFGKRARRYALPIAQKESQKWLRSYAAAARAQHACPGTRVISVGDREADLYELFARARDTAGGPDLLVRARQDRVVADIPFTKCGTPLAPRHPATK